MFMEFYSPFDREVRQGTFMHLTVRICLLCLLITVTTLFPHPLLQNAFAYDPLSVSETLRTSWADFTVDDPLRRRSIPIRVYLPSSKSTAPIVLFSHGLGGSREGSAYLAKHWSARGYASVFMQHTGSDASVWKEKPIGQRMMAIKKAAGIDSFLLRVRDVPAVIDQLDVWNRTSRHPLAGRLDLSRIGMSGHSFGAVTTQAVSGQLYGFQGFKKSLCDQRIKAAIMFSPSSPRRGLTPQEAFNDVKIPWLLMTGTNDVAFIGDADVPSRLAVFPALPPGGKYELVLYRAEHSAFTDRRLPGDSEDRNPNHHRAILAISTAFWDAWLREDADARAWLDGDGPRSVLEEEDRWQKK